MLERYGKIIGGFVAGVIVVGLVWGFATDWNFTSSNVMASGTKLPQDGDKCTLPTGGAGTIRGGVCTA